MTNLYSQFNYNDKNLYFYIPGRDISVFATVTAKHSHWMPSPLIIPFILQPCLYFGSPLSLSISKLVFFMASTASSHQKQKSPKLCSCSSYRNEHSSNHSAEIHLKYHAHLLAPSLLRISFLKSFRNVNINILYFSLSQYKLMILRFCAE